MDIYEIVGKLLAAFGVGVLTYLMHKMDIWLKISTDNAESESVQRLVRSFCRAAEQLLKADDPTGEKRHQYVVEHLEALGIEITALVLGMIEGEVFNINKGVSAE